MSVFCGYRATPSGLQITRREQYGIDGRSLRFGWLGLTAIQRRESMPPLDSLNVLLVT
jgi:hypothetical protein